MLLEQILMYYINMGASQFLRDFRRDCAIQKSAELRKQVLQRKEKSEEKANSVQFQVMFF